MWTVPTSRASEAPDERDGDRRTRQLRSDIWAPLEKVIIDGRDLLTEQHRAVAVVVPGAALEVPGVR